MSVPVTAGILIGATLIGGAILEATANLEAKHRADEAAQNAALAAADAHLGWIAHDPCALATTVAEASGAHLTACSLGDLDVQVTVRTTSLLGSRNGVARAGASDTSFEVS